MVPTRAALGTLLLATLPLRAQQPALLEQLGAAVKDCQLSADVALEPGVVPVLPSWSVQVKSTPIFHFDADAVDGRVTTLRARVEEGELILVGKGMLPDVVIEELEVDGATGVKSAKFHGRGLGALVIGLFRGTAMGALKKLRFKTDLPSVLKGDVLESAEKATPPPPTASPADPSAAAPPPTPAPPGPSFLDLVHEVRLTRFALTAFPERTLSMEPLLELTTGRGDEPFRMELSSATWRPARGGVPAAFTAEGTVDGAFTSGRFAYGADALAFSAGTLAGGRFSASSQEGKTSTSLSASRFALDLQSGRFLIGGVAVALGAPSRFVAEELAVSPGNEVSALLSLDLRGETGEIAASGSVLSLANVALKADKLKVANNRATGDAEVSFEYGVQHTLKVQYPVQGMEPKTVPLEFHGPFSARLHLENAGAGDEGSVTGDYVFKTAWPPIQQAAFEVLRARWIQDLPPAVKKVQLSVEPEEFAPCGPSCFGMRLVLTVEKTKDPKKKSSWFRQVCHPEGQATVVVDKEARAFVLKDAKLQPKCEGVLGVLVNFVAPFFAKSYQDMVLFQMPKELPFSVDDVKSGALWLEISGRVAWGKVPDGSQ